MDRTSFIWFAMAGLAALAAAGGMHAGIPILPLFLAAVGLICASHRPSRALVMEATSRFFAGGTVRAVLIILGGVMLIQFLPLEMALFAAGDVLAYVEVLAAVGLIAANTRLRPMKARAAERLSVWRARLTPSLGTAQRGPRTIRPRRRPSPPAKDGDGRPVAWAYA